jgi:hypothetical protein
LKKLPVCKACISGSLCLSCQERFDEGKVTQFGIDLANDLLTLEEKYPELKNASFYQAVDIGSTVFLVIGQGHRSRFKKELLDELCELYELPRIDLIEKGPVKKMIEQLIGPDVRLLGVNQIYIPTGDTEYRIIISKEDKDRIRIPINDLQKASSLIIREITKVSFN